MLAYLYASVCEHMHVHMYAHMIYDTYIYAYMHIYVDTYEHYIYDYITVCNTSVI